MELKLLIEIIWRQKWIITLSFLLVFGSSVIGSLSLPYIYESNALLLTGGSSTASSLLANLGFQIPASSQQNGLDAETHVELLTADSLLNAVIEKLQIRTEGDLMAPRDLLKGLPIVSAIKPKPHLEVELVADTTNLIEIVATAHDPDLAAMIANTVAEVYQSENLARRKEEYKSAKIFIESQLNITKNEYFKVLEQIRAFRASNNIIELESEQQASITKMAELMRDKEATIINLNETEAKIQVLRAQLEQQDSQNIAAATIKDNSFIEQLKNNINNLEQELSGALLEKHRTHPDVMILNKKLADSREKLSAEIEVFKQSATDLLALKSDREALKVHLATVNENITRYEAQFSVYPQLFFRNSQMDLEYNVNRSRYGTLLETLHEVGVAEAMTISDLRITEYATAQDTSDPASPNKMLNSVLGCFFGLLAGLFLGLVRDYFDDAIKSPDDVKKFKITHMGTILKFTKKDSPLIIGSDPKSSMSESYRIIRNSIRFASLDSPIKSIAITSSSGGEGKSTSSSNLAISFAQDGKKTVLLDCDLRKPQLHNMFKVSNKQGLTTVLAGEKKLDQVIQPCDQENLHILTCGPLPPDPGHLLESKMMQEIIKECEQKFDCIIIDTPPVLAAHDAVVMAQATDACLLVMEADKTSRQLFSRAQEYLQQGNVQVLGGILNKLHTGRTPYYGYYYTYGSNSS